MQAGRQAGVHASSASLTSVHLDAPTLAQVFDLRAGLRQLLSMPTAGLAASLAFHPLLPSGLLVALPSALFCIADTATGSASHVSQVGRTGATYQVAMHLPENHRNIAVRKTA